MSRLLPGLGICALTLGLAACSSAPIHFYTLMPPASQAHAPATAPYAIAVLPVAIPAQVDRPELVVRQGDSSVGLLDGQRWIGPLGDEIRNALSADLTVKLDAQDVYGLAAAPGVPVYQVRVDVKRFESVPGQYTLLVTTWAIEAADGKVRAAPCTARIEEAVGPGYAALAEGHQRGLHELASAIAEGMRALRHGQAVTCPRPH